MMMYATQNVKELIKILGFWSFFIKLYFKQFTRRQNVFVQLPKKNTPAFFRSVCVSECI